MGYEFSIQNTIYDVLSTTSAVTSLADVYDNVPQAADAGSDAAFPYITIGEDTLVEWDTDTELGADCTITIHTWSRYRGRKETKQIQGAIYAALHRANLTISGYNLVGIDWLQSESFMDTDGLTRHGVQTFRITIEE